MIFYCSTLNNNNKYTFMREYFSDAEMLTAQMTNQAFQVIK